jgi:hypothetical protein
MPTYERIFEKRVKGELQGREFLKKYYPQQWRIYNMNLKSARTWLSNIEDPRIRLFFSTNMRHNENSQADVKNFIKEHSGTLAGFIFHYQGLTIQMHWKEKDIYEYFKEYKHSQKKIGVLKKIPARDFPFGAVDDVVQGPKELGLDIAEELGNNMLDFQVHKMPILFNLPM